MTSDTIADDIRQFLLAGGCIAKIKTGVSGIDEPVQMTQKQVRDQTKKRFRKCQIELCVPKQYGENREL